MVYSYLDHICKLKLSLEDPQLLWVYLIGCLSIIQPEMAERFSVGVGTRVGDIVAASCCLIAEYQARDVREPRMLEQLVAHNTQLPIELLAKIFQSK
ncbi:Hypothetical protein POVR2_LOCUS167 [uncultured virus]|nr:Hypothetical protein POVR2_LOCUS167 [uncultured virus]